jgi:hypothetical protein
MSRQWLRAWKLEAAGKTFSGDLRVVFVCKSWIVGVPNNGTFTLYNLNKDSAASIQSLAKSGGGGTVTFSAGYRDNIGVIFSGKVIQVNLGKANATDTTTTIYATSDDTTHNIAHVNTTLKAGSTGLDIYNTLLKASPGMQAGNIPTQALQALKYPRSVTMFGPVRHFFRTLATSVGGDFHYDAINPQIHITQKNDPGKGSPIVLNSDTGMVGLPAQTGSGINVRCLLNPAIQKNSIVQIDQKSIQRITPFLTIGRPTSLQNLNEPGFSQFRGDISADGTYRVLSVEDVGDSRGDPWFTQANCLAVGGNATESQTRQGTV